MFLQVGGPAYRGDLRYYLKTMSRDYPGRYAHFIAPGPKHTALYRRESLLLDASYLPFDMELGGYSDTVVDGLSLGQWVSDMLSGSESWKPTPAE